MSKIFRNICVCCVAVLVAGTAYGATAARDSLTAGSVFADLRSPALELLDHSTRLDMLDYYKVGRKYTATNEMHGDATLDTLSQCYLRVQPTALSSVQIRIVPTPKGEMVLLSYTLDNDGADSELLIFSDKLKELPVGKYFKAPDLPDFLNTTDKQERARLMALTPFFTAEYTLSADPKAEAVLTVTPTLQNVMSEEDYASLLPYISNPDGSLRTLRYAWTGKALKLLK